MQSKGEMMALLTISRSDPGLHRSERLLTIETRDGPEEVFVDGSLVVDGKLDVSYPVGRQNGHVLVELPRESMRGKWRVWVQQNQLVET
jgi:hypothetical protein